MSESDLCEHCGTVVHMLSEKDDVDDRDSERVAKELWRQCCGPRDRSLR